MRKCVFIVLILTLFSSINFTGCRSVDPKEQHFGYGIVYMQKGDYDRSRQEFYKVLEIEQNCPEAEYNLALIADSLKDIKKSIKWAELAIKHYGERKSASETGTVSFTEDDQIKVSKAHVLLGSNYISMKKIDVAIEHYKIAAESTEGDPIIWENLGTAYLAQEKIELALESFKKALEVDPEHARAHISLAFIYEEIGEIELSKSHHSKARQLGEDDPYLIEILSWWDDWKTFNTRVEPKISFQYPPKWVASEKKSRVGRSRVVFDNTKAICYGKDAGTIQIIGPDKNYTILRRGQENPYDYAVKGLLNFLKTKTEFPKYFSDEIERQEKALESPNKVADKPKTNAPMSEIWSVDISDMEHYMYQNGSIGATIPVKVSWTSGDEFSIRFWFYLGQEESYVILGTYKVEKEIDETGKELFDVKSKNNRIKHALDFITKGFEVIPKKVE